MVGWVAHADSETDERTGGRRFADADRKTDRRSNPSGRVAHAHTEAGGFNRTVRLRFTRSRLLYAFLLTSGASYLFSIPVH